jgi:hypothetical protein
VSADGGRRTGKQAMKGSTPGRSQAAGTHGKNLTFMVPIPLCVLVDSNSKVI